MIKNQQTGKVERVRKKGNERGCVMFIRQKKGMHHRDAVDVGLFLFSSFTYDELIWRGWSQAGTTSGQRQQDPAQADPCEQ